MVVRYRQLEPRCSGIVAARDEGLTIWNWPLEKRSASLRKPTALAGLAASSGSEESYQTLAVRDEEDPASYAREKRPLFSILLIPWLVQTAAFPASM